MAAPTSVKIITPRAPLGHATLDLFDHARYCLTEAMTVTSPAERYIAAHLAALRAAAAVLAARAKPRTVRGPRNVWTLLAQVAPELSEWAAFFASSATKRAAAEAGLPRAVTARESDDLLREADVFLGVVASVLGLAYERPFTDTATAMRAY